MGLTVALVGEFDESVIAHRAIPEALRLASKGAVEPVWVPTNSIQEAGDLESFQGIWVVPASPYESMHGALEAIRFARISGRPFLGTCGGFQHAVIEYARNVLGWTETAHAETSPRSADPLISPLSCSLVEKQEMISLKPGSKIAWIYGKEIIEEGYHCNYGINPAYSSRLFSSKFLATAHNDTGEVRAIELSGHPFFVATLFQPERLALKGEVPPLVRSFCEAISCS